MKHLFIIISLVSLVLLNACGTEGEVVYAREADDTERSDNHADSPTSQVIDAQVYEHMSPCSQGDGQASLEQPKEIFVAVLGEVKYPGIYVFTEETRVFEAINAAEGATEYGDINRLDLVKKIDSDCTVIVPKKKEAGTQATEELKQAIPFINEAETGASDSSGNKLVNINTAGKEELMTVRGIGATRAEAIIKYRTENGPFNTCEDLMNVAGIKEGTFAKIRDSITVH